MANLQQAKQGLKNEIIETLNWMADMDISCYGTLQDGTKSAYKTQGVKIPKKYVA